MKISDQHVLTPADDPIEYDVDWRLKVVQASMATTGRSSLPANFRRDRDMMLLHDHLRMPTRGPRERLLCRLVLQWFAVPHLRALLEAMLLSEASYEDIGRSMGVAPDTVKLFQSLCFNVRDAEGKVLPGQVMRFRLLLAGEHSDPQGVASLDRMLKKAALEGGVETVFLLLGDPGSAQADKRAEFRTMLMLVEKELHRRMLDGSMQTRDLIRLRGVYVAQERMLHETSKGSDDQNEAMEVLLNLLRMMAPKMTQMEEEKSNRVPETMRAATRIITSTEVNDRGTLAGAEEINKRLGVKFAGVTG